MLLKTIITFFFFCATINIWAQTPLPLLTKCWEFSSNQPTNLKLASDNDQIIIFPEIDSKISALDRNGAVIWKNEYSGILLSETVIDSEKIYFLTINSEKADDALVFNIISLKTGLTIAEKKIKFPNPINNAEIILKKDEQFVLLVINKQYTFAINEQEEKIESFTEFNSPITSNIEVDRESLYFADKRGIVNYYLAKKRNSLLLETNSEKINLIFSPVQEKILTANNFGQVSFYDTETKKKKWTFRTGGEINSITKFADNYLVSSLDNYLYYLSAKNGRLIWKKRLEGRNEGISAEEQGQFISVIINGQTSIFTEPKKGRTVNQITLPAETLFISQPIIIQNLVIFSTNRGLIAYSFGKC
jgi:outer membrane protein assembly factor BamB